jgi:P27 family predicted phage terminase small subunit
MGKELARLGLLTKIDKAALAGYCTAWEHYVEASTKLQTKGTLALVVKAPSGYPIQSPYLAIANQALKQLRAFLVEFGMTPAARTRVQVAERQDADDDLLD